MSTHDSYLLCWASVLAYDVAVPLSGGRIGERGCLWLTRLGIVLIHQEQNLAEHLTVADSIFLGRELTKFGFLDLGEMRRRVLEALAKEAVGK